MRVFTAALVAASLLVVGLAVYQLRRVAAPGRVVDAALVALIAAVIGARLFHVLLTWDYFASHTAEIPRLNAGGLDWHGALLGGLLGLALAARIWRLPLPDLLDAFTLGLPLLALGVWYGCAAAACAYGLEVDTLAHFSPLVVSESRDVYGMIAPRYNTQGFGLLWSLALAALAVLLVTGHRLRFRRFWLVLTLLAVGMFLIGFWRGDVSPMLAGWWLDQWLDAAVAVFALATLVYLSRARWRSSRQHSAPLMI